MEEFRFLMNTKGWAYFDSVLDAKATEILGHELEKSFEICSSLQKKKGLPHMDCSVHHILGLSNHFLDFLKDKVLFDYVKDYFSQSVFILNSFGGVVNLKDSASYLFNPHRDVRMFTSPYRLMLNMLIMLDDFTLDNGATYLLSGSHNVPGHVTTEHFLKFAERGLGKKGSIILFDSNLWHAAGPNRTEGIRRGITITYTKSLLKPQFDYLGLYSEEKIQSFSEEMKQLLGYFSRVPRSLDEWYQPSDKRFYRQGQD